MTGRHLLLRKLPSPERRVTSEEKKAEEPPLGAER